MNSCYFCQAEAQVVKFEAEWNAHETEDEMVETKVALAICLACADEHYDGTEEYPETYPLARAA